MVYSLQPPCSCGYPLDPISLGCNCHRINVQYGIWIYNHLQLELHPKVCCSHANLFLYELLGHKQHVATEMMTKDTVIAREIALFKWVRFRSSVPYTAPSGSQIPTLGSVLILRPQKKASPMYIRNALEISRVKRRKCCFYGVLQHIDLYFTAATLGFCVPTDITLRPLRTFRAAPISYKHIRGSDPSLTEPENGKFHGKSYGRSMVVTW